MGSSCVFYMCFLLINSTEAPWYGSVFDSTSRPWALASHSCARPSWGTAPKDRMTSFWISGHCELSTQVTVQGFRPSGLWTKVQVQWELKCKFTPFVPCSNGKPKPRLQWYFLFWTWNWEHHTDKVLIGLDPLQTWSQGIFSFAAAHNNLD